MAKGRSFFDKTFKKKAQQDYTMVKYVKSVVSEKTGQVRFQESMLRLPKGMTMDSFLKQQEEAMIGTSSDESESEKKPTEG
ncbi:MAG: hypothetical protein ISR95_06730 [Candidatus Marinimicrobia bacterium]|nr:hypothetical protein [Candidatus Neomarinimicrobiota bacterium]